MLRGIDLDGRRARGRLPDRRVRLGQVDAAALHQPARADRRGPDRPRRRGDHRARRDVNAVRRRIGIVFQAYNLFPHMTVLRNVTLAPRDVLGLSSGEAESRAVGAARALRARRQARRVPRPALGRPAAARRDRARARDAARADAPRRGHERARPGARRRGARGDPRARRGRDDDADRDARDGRSRATSPTASASSTTAGSSSRARRRQIFTAPQEERTQQFLQRIIEARRL